MDIGANEIIYGGIACAAGIGLGAVFAQAAYSTAAMVICGATAGVAGASVADTMVSGTPLDLESNA